MNTIATHEIFIYIKITIKIVATKSTIGHNIPLQYILLKLFCELVSFRKLDSNKKAANKNPTAISVMIILNTFFVFFNYFYKVKPNIYIKLGLTLIDRLPFCLILLNHGIFTFDNDAKRSYDLMIKYVSVAERAIKKLKSKK